MLVFYSYRNRLYLDFQTIMRYYKYSRSSCYRELLNLKINTITYPDKNCRVLYDWEELKNNKTIWKQLDVGKIYKDLNS